MKTVVIFCLMFCANYLSAQHYNCQIRRFYQVVPLTDPNCCGRKQVYVSGEMPSCNYDGWVMYFEDNFDGQTLDLSKWRYPYQGVLAGFNFDGSKTWYANTGSTPALPYSTNVKVENNELKLIARKENTPINGTYVTNWATNPPTTSSSNFDYSSGWIESKKNFGYGWYEIRCQIPKGKGMWPAFWLFSGQDGYAFEIDVFEFWNENCNGNYDASKLSENVHMNLHSNRNPNNINRTCPAELYGTCGGYPSGYLSEGFHTYALEWDYYKIIWYIDGQAVRRDYRFTNTLGQNLDCNSATNPLFYADYWPSADNMNVRFNLGVQNGGDSPDANTTFPKEFVIDYFRYYKKASCETNKIVTTKPQLNLSTDLYNTLMGHNVTVSGTATVNNTEQLEVVGSNTIVLDPGFEADNGSEFSAHIAPDYCSINTSAITANSDEDEIQKETSKTRYQNLENTALGLNDFSDSDVLKVYPNPGADHIIIELTSSNGLNLIEISDNLGRLLLSDKNELDEAINLDISTFLPGAYVIKILNMETGKVYLERFTKAK